MKVTNWLPPIMEEAIDPGGWLIRMGCGCPPTIMAPGGRVAGALEMCVGVGGA